MGWLWRKLVIRRPQSLVSTVRRLFWFNFLLQEPVFDLFPFFVLRLIPFSIVASSPILISVLICVLLFVLFVVVPSLFSFVHRDLPLFLSFRSIIFPHSPFSLLHIDYFVVHCWPSLSFADISSPIDFVQKPITSRAHLLDIPLYLSRHSLPPLSAFSASSTISLATLVACAEESNVHIQPGDILVVRTGFTDELLKLTEEERDRLRKREVNGSCGVAQGKDILKWHWENGIAAVVADWYALRSFQD